MKEKVYLDSTILSYLFDSRIELKNFIDITKEWWEQEKNNYEVWISEETIAELSGGNYPRKIEIIEAASGIKLLNPRDSIIEIAQQYIDNYLMPKNLKGDAIHLAYASFYKIDYLLTWNCNHLANANKKNHIRNINTKLQLFIPEIITPLELFKETKE